MLVSIYPFTSTSVFYIFISIHAIRTKKFYCDKVCILIGVLGHVLETRYSGMWGFAAGSHLRWYKSSKSWKQIEWTEDFWQKRLKLFEKYVLHCHCVHHKSHTDWYRTWVSTQRLVNNTLSHQFVKIQQLH